MKNAAVIAEIDMAIEAIKLVQSRVSFDTSYSSEWNLDAAIDTLINVKAQVLTQET